MNLAAWLALGLSMVTPALSWAQINVSGVTLGGPNCDPQNTQVVFSPDHSSFSILFSGMNVETQSSPGDSAAYGYAQCSVDINMTIPAGMQLELRSVDYRGYMFLPSDQSYGTINSAHHFVGGTVDSPFGRSWGAQFVGGVSMINQGPFDSNVFYEANYGFGTTSGKHYTRCSGQADLKIRVEARTHTFNVAEVSRVDLDSGDGTFSTEYGLALMPCDAHNRRLDRICRRGSCPNR
jgi:hypothetical protein